MADAKPHGVVGSIDCSNRLCQCFNVKLSTDGVDNGTD